MSFRGAKKLWEKILQKGRSTSKYAIELIEKVMDSEPRTLNEILDKIFDELENKRKALPKYQQNRVTGHSVIPTRRELKFYLGKNYNSGLFDKYNNRQVSSKTKNSERRYWK